MAHLQKNTAIYTKKLAVTGLVDKKVEQEMYLRMDLQGAQIIGLKTPLSSLLQRKIFTWNTLVKEYRLCYARFATKITKNGFVTHRCARFFAEFACCAQDFFTIRAGARNSVVPPENIQKFYFQYYYLIYIYIDTK